jgi:2Fe-2S ferredoxin
MMTSICFVQPDGSRSVVNATIGESVMQVAVNNQVPGILGDCGGSCSCATCHAYVDDEWKARVPAADPLEGEVLYGAEHVRQNSRLTCEIKVTADLDGLVIHLPAA